MAKTGQIQREMDKDKGIMCAYVSGRATEIDRQTDRLREGKGAV